MNPILTGIANLAGRAAAAPAATKAAVAGGAAAAGLGATALAAQPADAIQSEALGRDTYRVTVAPDSDLGQAAVEYLSQYGEGVPMEDGRIAFTLRGGQYARAEQALKDYQSRSGAQ